MRATPSIEISPAPLGHTFFSYLANLLESRHMSLVRTRVIRRRPTRSQGQALESLGHAIEYLVDSRMHRDRGLSSSADGEAEQIIMRLNREVFAECAEVAPSVGSKLWMMKTLRAAMKV
jgi:hypothetical protein